MYFLNRRYYTLKCYKWKELNDIFFKKIEKALEELYNGFMKLITAGDQAMIQPKKETGRINNRRKMV